VVIGAGGAGGGVAGRVKLLELCDKGVGTGPSPPIGVGPEAGVVVKARLTAEVGAEARDAGRFVGDDTFDSDAVGSSDTTPVLP